MSRICGNPPTTCCASVADLSGDFSVVFSDPEPTIRSNDVSLESNRFLDQYYHVITDLMRSGHNFRVVELPVGNTSIPFMATGLLQDKVILGVHKDLFSDLESDVRTHSGVPVDRLVHFVRNWQKELKSLQMPDDVSIGQDGIILLDRRDEKNREQIWSAAIEEASHAVVAQVVDPAHIVADPQWIKIGHDYVAGKPSAVVRFGDKDIFHRVIGLILQGVNLGNYSGTDLDTIREYVRIRCHILVAGPLSNNIHTSAESILDSGRMRPFSWELVQSSREWRLTDDQKLMIALYFMFAPPGHLSVFARPGQDWNFVDLISGFFKNSMADSVRPSVDEFLSEILAQTSSILARFEPAVNALANALVYQRRMDWNQAQTIIEESIRDSALDVRT